MSPFKFFLGWAVAFQLLFAGASAAEPAAYEPPALIDENGWTMVVVPDPQTYVKLTRNQGIYELMTAWIADNLAALKIQQVLVTGDLVCYNGIKEHRPNINDQTGEEQWQAFSRSTARLDGRVPYVLCTGNHDYGILSAENRETGLDRYFPPDRNPAARPHLIECGPNSFGRKTLENAAYRFTAPDGRRLLILAVAFAPTDGELAWAKELAARPEYKDDFGILLTHSYLDRNGHRIESEKYQLNQDGGNAGAAIWEKLVRVSPNLRMVICGHIARPDDWAGGISFSTATNDAGREVYQMAFNTQAIGGGWHGNGGDGWLRLLEFSPGLRSIKVRTFSPLFAISPSTRHLAWRREPLNQFEITVAD
jgi:hypothetical protein